MAKKAKRKQSYGGCSIDHFSPPRTDGWPKAINVVLSFEEALKLHLALQAGLMAINGLKRSTKEGKLAALNLCVYTAVNRITLNANKLAASGSA